MKHKSENALKTIGELSQIIDVPAHVIRFWETKFSQIKPIKYNNRRYFDQKATDLLKRIKFILYEEKYTISEAIDLLKTHNNETVHKQLLLFENEPLEETSQGNSNDLYLVEVKEKLINAKNRLNALIQ